MDERVIKKLVSNMKCAVCGQHYEASNVHVLGHRDDMWFVGIFCTSCHSQGLVAAVVKEGNLPQIVTELSDAEESKFAASDLVGCDDVLDVHDFLSDFDGDFSKLFSSR